MRWFLFAFLGTLLFAGCGPGADPLDWKIDAGDPDELDQWLQQKIRLMTAETGSELSGAIGNIRVGIREKGIAGAREICKQLDGRSVRAVIISGYEIGNDQARAQIENESEALLRLAKTGDTLPADRLEKLFSFHQKRRASLQKTLEKSEARLAALRAELLAQ